MAQRFVSLEDAAKELGVSKDRLSELREDGKVRAYRDGASWKFRAEDIEKLAAEGIPGGDPGASDLSLDLNIDEPSTPEAASDLKLDLDTETESTSTPAELSDIQLDLGDDEVRAGAGVSDISLEDLDEPTVPVDPATDSDEVLMDVEGEIDEMADSILLSEAELGESTDRPPSTIIGKAEMAAELDLKMASDSDVAAKSDVKLAPSTSNVFSSSSSDAVLDIEPPSLSDNFGDLEELEIDLEAESSRILSPDDVSKAQQAARAAAKSPEISDLELAASDSNAGPGASGDAMDSIIGGGSDLAGLSALELEGDDDDEVLGEGSDITLSSESSGINIISPSDSGLALDELAAGSMGSPLDLGAVDQEVGLEPLEVDEGAASEKGEEPFALTPFGEEVAEEEDDSSQIIPLDEVSEEEAGPALGLGIGHGEGISDEFATAAFGAAPVGEPVVETPFSTANVVGLVLCVIPLALVGMMMFDLLRNIWSWDQVYSLNSTLLEMLNPFIG
jgi:excisionase family DNA binding protein